MKNLIKVVISGISIGVAVLMLGYIAIYYISGEEVFMKEIALLGQIKILQLQLIITGISGMLIALSMYYIEKVRTKDNEITFKVVLGLVFLTLSSIIAMMLIETMNENIADMLVMFAAIFVSAYALLNSMRTLWYDMNSNIKKQENVQEVEKGN